MRPVLQLIERVGPSDANVLITGENGTGKGVVAQALHAASPPRRPALGHGQRRRLSPKASSRASCSATCSGAFTDAKSDRVGRFELADGGTLFLDEIANAAAQPAGQAAARARDRRVRARSGSSQTRQGRTCGSSRPPTPTCGARWPPAASARTCSSGSTRSRSSCRRCASAGRTSARSPSTSSRRHAAALPQAGRRLRARRLEALAGRTPGPATCASSTTRSSARC